MYCEGVMRIIRGTVQHSANVAKNSWGWGYNLKLCSFFPWNVHCIYKKKLIIENLNDPVFIYCSQ